VKFRRMIVEMLGYNLDGLVVTDVGWKPRAKLPANEDVLVSRPLSKAVWHRGLRTFHAR
jgi:hypothetical protein